MSTSMTGEQIYQNFQNGDAREMGTAAQAVHDLVGEYNDLGRSLVQLAGRMDGAWEGEAAGAAQRGAGPLAVEHQTAAPHVSTASRSMEDQVNAFGQAKNSVVPMPPKPEAPNPVENILNPTEGLSYASKLKDYVDKSNQNVEAMKSYEQSSTSNGDAMPTTYGNIDLDQAGIQITPEEGGGRHDPGGSQRGTVPAGPVGGDAGSYGGSSGGSFGGGAVTNPPTGAGAGTGDYGGGVPSAGSGSAPQVSSPPDSTTDAAASWGTGGAGGFGPGSGGPGSAGFGPGVPGAGQGSGSGSGTGFGGGMPVGGAAGSGAGGAGGAGSGSGGAGGRTGGFGAGRAGGFGGGAPGSGAGGPGGPAPRTGMGSFGPGSGGPAAAGSAASGSGAGGRGMMAPMGGAAKGQGGEDEEHQTASYLDAGDDPENLFGTDELTAPPVIGE